MAYQVPKASHPWRQYKNRRPKEQKAEKKGKSVKIFVREMAESWERIEITTVAKGKEDRFFLEELPQSRQAAWFAGLLKKYYSAQ